MFRVSAAQGSAAIFNEEKSFEDEANRKSLFRLAWSVQFVMVSFRLPFLGSLVISMNGRSLI